MSSGSTHRGRGQRGTSHRHHTATEHSGEEAAAQEGREGLETWGLGGFTQILAPPGEDIYPIHLSADASRCWVMLSQSSASTVPLFSTQI